MENARQALGFITELEDHPRVGELGSGTVLRAYANAFVFLDTQVIEASTDEEDEYDDDDFPPPNISYRDATELLADMFAPVGALAKSSPKSDPIDEITVGKFEFTGGFSTAGLLRFGDAKPLYPDVAKYPSQDVLTITRAAWLYAMLSVNLIMQGLDGGESGYAAETQLEFLTKVSRVDIEDMDDVCSRAWRGVMDVVEYQLRETIPPLVTKVNRLDIFDIVESDARPGSLARPERRNPFTAGRAVIPGVYRL